MPNALGGVIVPAADKYASIGDVIRGGELRKTGLRYAPRDLASGIRGKK